MTIEFKHKADQRVYFMHENKVTDGIVRLIRIEISNRGSKTVYELSNPNIEKNVYLSEDKVFSSKEELLESL